VRCNGDLDARLARTTIRLEPEAERVLARAYTIGALSARGRLRVLRVARTIADLASQELVREDDLLMALALRQRSSGEALAA
jgi:magnesium chelatase family protein